MKRQLWLASFACVLSLAATHSQPLIAQNVIPDIRATQADGKAAKIIVFDPPGGPDYNLSTLAYDPTGIDAAGSVIGSYQNLDSDDGGLGAIYGYYRLADGTLHRFHADPVVKDYYVGAVPTAIAADGSVIIGSFSRTEGYASNRIGFIRYRAGTTEFTPFDSIDTEPQAINSSGTITGKYEDPAQITHGFVRDAEGNFTSFDAPGSGPVTQTWPEAINSQGAIVGFTLGALTANGYQVTGFLRDSNGNMTVISPEQSTSLNGLTISDDGLVIGSFSVDARHIQAFIRDTEGKYTLFSVPGATETVPVAVDPQGSIIGWYKDAKTYAKGFYRLRDGTFGLFVPPASFETYPTAISPKGDITGYFSDENGIYRHNFIRINPDPPAATATQDGNASVQTAQ